MKKRLDLFLKEKGLVNSREKAKVLIKSGFVYVDDNIIKDASFLVDNESIVKLKNSFKYVSRGGFKLEEAIKSFSIKVEGKSCLDIGSSTGGFTDCLLQNAAKEVYCVDVGYGQLDYKLRKDKRVKVFERVNARYLDYNFFKKEFDIIVCDVSFISVKKLINVFLNFSKEDTDIIILFKPQFEAPKGSTKKGVIKDKSIYREILLDFIRFFYDNKLYFKDIVQSPIKGRKGNIEFLLYFKKNKDFNIDFLNKVDEVLRSI